jgi:Alpha galactosidase A/Alpha galactosidase C-terminal beta sandwich domain
MSGKSGEAFLQSIADFFVANNMVSSCFTYVNSDEGWELHDRNSTTHQLMWDPAQYPDGIPGFVAKLKAQGIQLGLYGASSGVTCGSISGQLGFEDIDAQTISEWGIGYWKSDNCASYAMDSSVRFAAFRDALARLNAKIVLSIEPFSINVDLRQSRNLANLWRVSKDMPFGGSWTGFLDNADVSDKWAPIAGPGGWNDPDMINIRTSLTDGENRAYFGLWCIMKSPLLLSADLPNLPANLQAIITNPEVVAINQDSLGIQGRKLLVDSNPFQWLVGLESCDAGPSGGLSGGLHRSWNGLNTSAVPGGDVRTWHTVPSDSPSAFLVVNTATGRCLVNTTSAVYSSKQTVVLVPCDASDSHQQWTFAIPHTVSALIHVSSGLALAVPNSTLFGAPRGDDNSTVDASYGTSELILVPYTPQLPCTDRNCEGYDPSQLWYLDEQDGFLSHATYTSSINHCFDGNCYELTKKMPTYQHQCLSHVLSNANRPSVRGTSSEVWGGPLSNGKFVLGFLNLGTSSSTNSINFSSFDLMNVGDGTSYCVRDSWARTNVGTFTGSFSATIASHDLGVFLLTPGAC